jgi:hypothetical protein
MLALVYFLNKPKPVTGAKHVTDTLKEEDGMETSYEADTDAEYLVQVLDELTKSTDFVYETVDSDYGPYIISINNVVADYNVNQKYWAIYVNGEYGMYGADSQPVADSDSFSLVYEVFDASAETDAAQ